MNQGGTKSGFDLTVINSYAVWLSVLLWPAQGLYRGLPHKVHMSCLRHELTKLVQHRFHGAHQLSYIIFPRPHCLSTRFAFDSKEDTRSPPCNTEKDADLG